MTEAVQPGTPEWDALVAEAKSRASDYNWWLGDTALKIVPSGDDQRNTGALSNLRLFAEQIDQTYETLKNCRDVSRAWPHALRRACSWSTHRELMAHKHLIHDRMTVKEARELLDRPGPSYSPPPTGASDKARHIREQLRDPEVRAEYEAQVVANGGRIPSLDELNSRGGGAFDTVLDEGDRFSAWLRQFDAVLDAGHQLGPWGQGTYQAREIQARNLRLLDLVVSAMPTSQVDA